MSTCVVCASSNLQCWKCERISLKFKIASLQKELSQFYTSDIEKFYLSYHDKQLSQKYHTVRSPLPINYEYKEKLSTSYFITITFDPARFGMQPFDEERKDYIIHKMYNVMDYQLIKEVYGSFERHKNGIIHTHAIITAYFDDIKQINKVMKSYFTDNPYNKIAIDIGPAKYPQAKEYMEKESDDYYLISRKRVMKKHPIVVSAVDEDSDDKNPLDYGL